jgi:hypothetical protein
VSYADKIKSVGEGFEEFRRAFKAVQSDRLALLRAIGSGRPGSIYELA